MLWWLMPLVDGGGGWGVVRGEGRGGGWGEVGGVAGF